MPDRIEGDQIWILGDRYCSENLPGVRVDGHRLLICASHQEHGRSFVEGKTRCVIALWQHDLLDQLACRDVDDRDFAVIGDRSEDQSMSVWNWRTRIAIQHQISEHGARFRVGKDDIVADAIHDHDLASGGLYRGAVRLGARWDFAKYFTRAAVEDYRLGQAAIRGKRAIVIQENDSVYLLTFDELGIHLAAVEIDCRDPVLAPNVDTVSRRIVDGVVPERVARLKCPQHRIGLGRFVRCHRRTEPKAGNDSEQSSTNSHPYLLLLRLVTERDERLRTIRRDGQSGLLAFGLPPFRDCRTGLSRGEADIMPCDASRRAKVRVRQHRS